MRSASADNSIAIQASWPLVQILLTSLCIVLIFWGLAGNNYGALVSGISCIPTMLLVYAQQKLRSTDLLLPLNFILPQIFFGVTLQTFYIAYGDSEVSQSQLYGRDISVLFYGLFAISVGVASLLAGYMLTNPELRRPRNSLFRNDNWDGGRVTVVVVALSVIGVLSLGYFVSQMNVLTDFGSTFSTKRRIELAGGAYGVAGYFRWGAELMQIAFLILLTRQLKQGLYGVVSGSTWIVPLLFGLMTLVIPFISSVRSEILYILISILIVKNYIGKRLTIRSLVIVMAIGIAVLLVMGSLRYVQSRDLGAGAYKEQITQSALTNTIAGSANLLSVGKTSVLIESIPYFAEYEFGRTFFLWIVAPVPRSIWPDKPIISIGGFLGPQVFETRFSTGIPPGIVGEFYLNFGYAGVIVGMFLLGALLKLVYVKLGGLAVRNNNALILYVLTVVPFALIIFGGDFSGTMIKYTKMIIPAYFILKFISTRIPVQLGRTHRRIAK